jgi:hypothetical protein
VHFTSSDVLAEIAQVWKKWLGRRGCISVKQMHSARKAEYVRSGLSNRMSEYDSDPSYVLSRILSGEDNEDIATYEIPEVVSYVKSGNCYAEHVFDLNLTRSSITANLTLFEREDWVYSVEWCTLPFRSYNLIKKLSTDSTKQAGVGKRVCDGIRSEHFKSCPFLATCVQQFSMWVQSASAILNDDAAAISFTFNNQHALAFCRSQSSYQFDVIFSSNLMGHLGPSNLVPPALPLLKPEGLLFTTTFHHDDVAHTVEDYVSVCFGFNYKLLPEILGIRFIEGDSTDPANILKQLNMGHKLLIWSEVPRKEGEAINSLPSLQLGNITEGIANSIVDSTAALVPILNTNPNRPLVVYNSNIETAMFMLQKFKSLARLCSDNECQFWEPVCSSLRAFPVFRPFLAGLKTQALLNGLHMHFGFFCPLCQGIPVEKFVGLFCAKLLLPLDVLYSSAHFMALIHSSPRLMLQDESKLSLDDLSDNNLTVIDAIDGIVDGMILKLKFFAPLHYATNDCYVTIVRFLFREGGGSIIHVELPATRIRTLLVEFERYSFSQAPGARASNSVCNSTRDGCTSAESQSSRHTLVEPAALAKSQPEERCSSCNKLGIMSTCKQCKRARYCDVECQAKHWRRHKHDCRVSAMMRAIRHLNMLPSLPVESMHCAFCDSTPSELKACTRCKKAKYCGKECQRKHWNVHKDSCSK